MKVVSLIIGILLLVTTFGYCKPLLWGVGVSYPGLSLKYFLTEKLAMEGKFQGESNVSLGGTRGYFYFNSPPNKFLLFTGLETDMIGFKSEQSEGYGIIYGMFLGSEYFFTPNISVQIDIGPMWVGLKDNSTSVVVNGFDYIPNVSLNYYFR